VSQEQAAASLRLGNTRNLVSLNRESPDGIVDHFAIGIPKFNKDVAVRYLKRARRNAPWRKLRRLHSRIRWRQSADQRTELIVFRGPRSTIAARDRSGAGLEVSDLRTGISKPSALRK